MTSSDPQVIPLSTMTRFEDYRFVGKRPASSNWEADMKYLYEQQIFTEEQEEEAIDEMGDVFVPNYRFTAEGYEYKTTAVFEEESAFFESVAPELGLVGEDDPDEEDGSARKRNMVIIGPDSRTVVPDTKKYPFRTIGQVRFCSYDLRTLQLKSISHMHTYTHTQSDILQSRSLSHRRITFGEKVGVLLP